ncbi:hypothetical protein SAMN05421542_4364 [Chryseobacterium jejuense]|uniref:Uncharacterized protein n=1 Tax=Chryseobacterium jejuense TaxID=445960 RepID=A0A2X2YYR8_CHRJE|nr:hypothetical protein SAMN05421542_4364 [Chryseobacterium jejuense]SQB43470.1 Uncharacterised protein [Chryseobacterium jejuense]
MIPERHLKKARQLAQQTPINSVLLYTICFHRTGLAPAPLLPHEVILFYGTCFIFSIGFFCISSSFAETWFPLHSPLQSHVENNMNTLNHFRIGAWKSVLRKFSSENQSIHIHWFRRFVLLFYFFS